MCKLRNVLLGTLICFLQPLLVEAQCFKDSDRCVFLTGQLSEQNVATLRSQIHDIDYVILNSGGGMAFYGRQIGILLYNHNKPLYVIGECSSACAEYILPGAPIVFAVNDPSFHLHGSTLINRNIAYERGFEISETCPWNSVKWLEFIYDKRGLNPGFAQIQRWVTGDPKIDFEAHGEGCLRVVDLELPENSWNAPEFALKYLWGLNIHNVEWSPNGDFRSQSPYRHDLTLGLAFNLIGHGVLLFR